MALFLNESAHVRRSTQTLEEILVEGIELSNAYNSLNEAIYQADFIMDSKRTTLTESAFQNLQEGFVSNVWEKIKEYSTKAWEWIKKFWNKIKDKTVEMYNRIKERLSGDGLEINKSSVKILEIKIKACDYGNSVIGKAAKQSDANSVGKFLQDTTSKFESFKKELEEAKKLTGTQKVSPTYIGKLQSSVAGIGAAIDAAAKEAEAKLHATEGKFKEVAAKSNAVAAGSMDTDQKSHEIALLKAIVNAIRSMVTQLGGITNAPMPFVGPMLPTNGPERPDA